MPLSEADTHANLVNPALYARGWTEDHIKREETTGAAELVAGKARRRSKGRTDLTLRVVVTAETQPVAVIEERPVQNSRECGMESREWRVWSVEWGARNSELPIPTPH
jgi:type I site-specific restriction endonuclease